MSHGVSRRGFFSALSRPFQKMARDTSGLRFHEAPESAPDRSKAVPALLEHPHRHVMIRKLEASPQGRDGLAAGVISSESAARTAIIQGRFCIALTSFCSVCTERCPVPGAMKKERGLPMVVPDVCTGCGVCQAVCPAPRNAVLMLPRRQPAAPVSA